MIDDAIKRLEEISKRADEPQAEEEEEEDDEDRVEEAQSLLQQIKENMEVNDGRLDDSLLVRLYRDKLTSKPALNQGQYSDCEFKLSRLYHIVYILILKVLTLILRCHC